MACGCACGPAETLSPYFDGIGELAGCNVDGDAAKVAIIHVEESFAVEPAIIGEPTVELEFLLGRITSVKVTFPL